LSQIGLVLLRLSLILVGYASAALAASLFLHFVAWPFVADIGQEAPWLLVGGLFVSIPLAALFLSYFACLPAAVLIGLSEFRGYRSWLYHALSGGVAAFAAVVLARQTHGMPVPDSHGEIPLIWMPEIMAATVAAGLVGGVAYWLVAGRSARGWFVPTAPAPSESSPRRQ
jgi:Na+/citrate or Na+/malate symporter